VPGEVIPLRPLTLSELLDAAVELLRRNARGLLPVAAGLALAEQVLLYPIRTLAQVEPPYLSGGSAMVGYWVLLATGLGTEAAIISVLGGLAARTAVPALVDGPAAPRWLLGRGSRLGSLVGLAALVAPAAAVTSLAGLLVALVAPAPARADDVLPLWFAIALTWVFSFLPWAVWYLFTGLAAPAVVIERRGPAPALGRSFVMVGRGRLRPGFIRLLGYVAWLAVRLALAAGSLAALRLFHVSGLVLPTVLAAGAWALVNAVAYPAIGCLDAVLYLENRMRVEGLDLALARGLRNGVRPERILAG
jgi:hypothetical protein